jgi:hypothetical protein
MTDFVAQNDDELICTLPTLAAGAAYFKKWNRKLEVARDALEKNPKQNTEDISQDYRYKIGYIRGLRDMLEDPQKTLDKINLRNTRR